MANGAIDDKTANDRRRHALKRFMRQYDMTPADLARKAGLKGANLLYNYLSGRSNSLSVDTLERISKVVPGQNVASLIGASKFESFKGVTAVSVVYRLKHGTFTDSAYIRPEQQYQVGVRDALPEGAFGAEVSDDAMGGVYEPGSVLIVCPMKSLKADLAAGMRVVARRLDDLVGREEVAAWEIAKGKDGGLLQTRKGETIAMRWPYRGPFTADSLTVEILGPVLMAISNEGWWSRPNR
jgi:transcriptional regulator with XRE-family HTH domain